MELKYKTRSDTDPRGKPRVFFTCHPADFTVYSEQIFREILSACDCAVFYYDPAERPPYGGAASAEYDGNYFFDLSQMQLIVMPITTKLLLQKNEAVDVVLAYALAHKRPILPLMQETGLDEPFARIFGEMHYLTECVPSAERPLYRKKLTQYLESVLVGSELADRIRREFDNRIFLSYRKKDREQAHRLMRLIHDNSFCRDIAIWYDEFLRPGDNFNEEIFAALDDSRLFALAVTPNLLEEGNYVMREEYPYAKRTGKKILPAQMIETDQAALSARYEGLTHVVDASDAPALSADLAASLEELAERDNDGDPEHNYLIGLAYLNGIDVEVDSDRAVKLITESAEAGYGEAVEQLITMYRRGVGIARDYAAAAPWQKKLLEISYELWETDPSEEKALRFLTALREYGEALRDLRYWDRAFEVFKELYVNANDINDTYATEETEDALAEGLRLLGESSLSVSQRPLAEECYEEIMKLRSARFEEERTYENLLSLSDACLYMAEFLRDGNKLEEAHTLLKAVLEHLETLEKIRKEESLQIRYADTYLKLADIYGAVEDLDRARTFSRAAVQIYEDLVKTTGESRYRRAAATGYKALAEIARQQKQEDVMFEAYYFALRHYEGLAESEDTLQSYEDLIGIYRTCSTLRRTDLNRRAWLKKQEETEALLYARRPDYAEYAEGLETATQKRKRRDAWEKRLLIAGLSSFVVGVACGVVPKSAVGMPWYLVLQLVAVIGCFFMIMVTILFMTQHMGGFILERREGDDVHTHLLAMELDACGKKVRRRRLYRVICVLGFVLQTLTGIFLCLHQNTMIFGEMQRATFNVCVIVESLCLTTSVICSQLLHKNI